MPNRQHCVQFWKLPTQALNHSTLKLLSIHCYKCFVGFRRIRLILQSSMWRKVSSNRGKLSKISSHRAERKCHRLNFRTVYTPRQFSVAACCINCLPRVCQTVVAPALRVTKLVCAQFRKSQTRPKSLHPTVQWTRRSTSSSGSGCSSSASSPASSSSTASSSSSVPTSGPSYCDSDTGTTLLNHKFKNKLFF